MKMRVVYSIVMILIVMLVVSSTGVDVGCAVSASEDELPDAPLSLETEGRDTWSVILTWSDNSDNEDGFKVFRKIGRRGEFTLICNLDKNVTEYVDTPLLPEVLYGYKVCAYNKDGKTFSGESWILPIQKPANPELKPGESAGANSGMLSAYSDDSLTLVWRDESKYEKGYEISRKINSSKFTDGYRVVATIPANSERYKDTGLDFGTSYDYLVTAVGERTRSASSLVFGTTSIPDDKITPPTLVAMGGDDYEGSICTGGFRRTFRVHVPSSYKDNQFTSLILAFHGGGGQGVDQEKTSEMSDLSDKKGFIVVYPDGTGRQWNSNHDPAGFPTRFEVDDVDFVSQLIDLLEDEFLIDSDRIYSTGLSNGGFFSYRLASQLPKQIAAIASVAGSMSSLMEYHPDHPVAVIQFHGTADTFAPWEGGTTKTGTGKCRSITDVVDFWVKHNECSEKPVITYRKGDVTCYTYDGGRDNTEVVLCKILDGGHTWPGGVRLLPEWYVGSLTRNISATDAIWDFFERHKLPSKIPQISLTKPRNRHVYINDEEVVPFETKPVLGSSMVIGSLTIKASIMFEDKKIERVEFYVDDDLMFTDTEFPYEWSWDNPKAGYHEIKSVGYSGDKSVEDTTVVTVFRSD